MPDMKVSRSFHDQAYSEENIARRHRLRELWRAANPQKPFPPTEEARRDIRSDSRHALCRAKDEPCGCAIKEDE